MGLVAVADFKNMIDDCVSELSGTAFIVFFASLIRMTSNDSFICGAVVFFVYTFASYSNYKFSKSHFNPAITLAYYFLGEIELITAIVYVCCQVAGSVGAALLALLISKVETTGTTVGCPWRGSFKFEGKDFVPVNYFQRNFFFEKYFEIFFSDFFNFLSLDD